MSDFDNKPQLTLKDLAVNHPYYCSDSNYYSNDAAMFFATCSDFLDEFSDADIDLNYCFRWDVALKDEENPSIGYEAKVFIMVQRKGRFMPITIGSIYEEDVERFVSYLQAHANYHKAIWQPIMPA